MDKNKSLTQTYFEADENYKDKMENNKLRAILYGWYDYKKGIKYVHNTPEKVRMCFPNKLEDRTDGKLIKIFVDKIENYP